MCKLIIAVFVLGLPATHAYAQSQERNPNVILILADDSCYGADDIATPNIDRMANEGAFLGVVEQIKTDLHVDEINFVIGRLSDSGLGKKDWDHIRDVQKKIGEAGPRNAWINTDDLNDDDVAKDGTPLKPNDLHYSEKGYRLLAERFASKAIELLEKAKLDQ